MSNFLSLTSLQSFGRAANEIKNAHEKMNREMQNKDDQMYQLEQKISTTQRYSYYTLVKEASYL